MQRQSKDSERIGIFSLPVRYCRQGTGGSYRPVWQNGEANLPGPGAMSYAYMSLGLAPFAPAGRGMTSRQSPCPTRPTLWAQQAVCVNGTALTAGQLISQPLFDPNTGSMGG